MLEKKFCKTCGAEIVFCYIIPSRSYRIKGGEIKRDDAWTGPGWDDPKFKFYCSNDREHDIEDVNGIDVNEWCDNIEKYFLENALFDI